MGIKMDKYSKIVQNKLNKIIPESIQNKTSIRQKDKYLEVMEKYINQ